MRGLRQEIRTGLRALTAKPGFSVMIILSLALGIGLNSCVFNIFYTVLLKRLPFREPDRLVAVWSLLPPKLAQVCGTKRNLSSYPNIKDWKEQNRVFEGISAFRPGRKMTLSGVTAPQQVDAVAVCEDFFAVLGVRPILGRDFRPDEHQPGGNRLVVLTDSLWRSRFQADPGILGRTVSLDQEPMTVIGVLPPSFTFAVDFGPYGILSEPELFTPYALREYDYRSNNGFFPLARLKPAVTVERADTAMKLIAAQLEKAYPDSNKGFGVEIVPLHESMRGEHRPVLLVLLTAATLVLLIACLNVANLLLTRSLARHTEFAVRSSLGAGPLRMARQLLTEGLIFAIPGGALGMLIAFWGSRIADPILRSEIKGLPELRVNAPLLLFALTVAVLTALLFSLAPFLQVLKSGSSETLRQTGQGRPSGVRRYRLAPLFVVAQIGITVVLLVAAGLVFKSLKHVLDVDPGFRAENLLAAEVALPFSSARYDSPVKRADFYTRLAERIAALPGVQSVATSGAMPSHRAGNLAFRTPSGRCQALQAAGEIPNADYDVVSPEYFRTVGIGLKSGRVFQRFDTGKSV
jgi:putative ABC transport system permease protein